MGKTRVPGLTGDRHTEFTQNIGRAGPPTTELPSCLDAMIQSEHCAGGETEAQRDAGPFTCGRIRQTFVRGPVWKKLASHGERRSAGLATAPGAMAVGGEPAGGREFLAGSLEEAAPDLRREMNQERGVSRGKSVLKVMEAE